MIALNNRKLFLMLAKDIYSRAEPRVSFQLHVFGRMLQSQTRNSLVLTISSNISELNMKVG